LVIFIGLNSVGVIEVNYFQVSKEKLKIYIGNLMYILAIMTSVFIIFNLLFGEYIFKFTHISKEWMFLAIFIALFQIITTLNLVLFRVKHNAKAYSLYEIAQNLFNVSLTLILVVGFHFKWEGRLIAMGVAFILFGMLSFYIIYKTKNLIVFKYKKEYLKDILHYGIPLIPHSLAGWIKTGLDRIFITGLISVSATGIYSVGYQLGTVIAVIATSLYKAWLPKLYEMLSKGLDEKEKLKIVKITYLYFICMILLAILLYCFLVFFMDIFIDKKFEGSKIIIFYILIAYTFDAMYFAVVCYIFYFKKTKYISMVTLFTSFLHAPLSYILIKNHGIEGATFVSVLTFGISFFIIWYVSNKVYPMPWFSFWRK
jgi:O-antigen/teichoic acid export membrane protein